MTKKNQKSTKFKVLLIQLRQLGDILLTTPLIPALKEVSKSTEKESGSELEIHFLSHQMGGLILNDFEGLSKLWTYHEKAPLLEQAGLIRDLRRESFDVVVDLMNNPRSALLTFLTGAPHRLGFRSARRWAYHHSLSKSGSDTYIVQEKLRFMGEIEKILIFEKILKPTPEVISPPSSSFPLPLVPFFPKDAQKAWHFFQSQTSPTSLRVILSPTHRHPVRQWPLQNFAATADWLVQAGRTMAQDAGVPGTEVYWLWGPGEEDVVDRCMALCQEPTTKLPPTTFREMAVFIANSDMFIGNSNGPSHVAVSVQTPSIQLHGPSDGRSWCPPLNGYQFVQGSSIDAIKPDDLMRKVVALFPHSLDRYKKRQARPFMDRSQQYWSV